MKVKPGARQLAHVITGSGNDPLMVDWELPNGARTFALTSESCRLVEIFGSRWEYAYDYVGNMMIYLDRRRVPQDIALVHAARGKILETGTRRSLLLALLEFCESFGANTDTITKRIDELDRATASALPQYLDQRFEEVLETYNEVDQILKEAEEEAVQVKNRTLLWIYIIEWLAVTETFMDCGFLLWSLMIRRRLLELAVARQDNFLCLSLHDRDIRKKEVGSKMMFRAQGGEIRGKVNKLIYGGKHRFPCLYNQLVINAGLIVIN